MYIATSENGRSSKLLDECCLLYRQLYPQVRMVPFMPLLYINIYHSIPLKYHIKICVKKRKTNCRVHIIYQIVDSFNEKFVTTLKKGKSQFTGFTEGLIAHVIVCPSPTSISAHSFWLTFQRWTFKLKLQPFQHGYAIYAKSNLIIHIFCIMLKDLFASQIAVSLSEIGKMNGKWHINHTFQYIQLELNMTNFFSVHLLYVY